MDTKPGISIGNFIFLLLLTLKLVNNGNAVSSWPWLWVLSPLLIQWSLMLLLYLISENKNDQISIMADYTLKDTILRKQFKIKDGVSPKYFVKKLNLNIAKMFVENNEDPAGYSVSYQIGWMNEDFIKFRHTIIITATKIL